MAKKLTRAYLDDIGFIYRTPDSPEDVDADPTYFDELVLDLTDTNKYFDDDPAVSGILRDFRVICGNFPERYSWAVFTVEGIRRKFNKGRAPDFFLQCSRNGDWKRVDMNPPEMKTAVVDPGPVKRGPGRPRKELEAVVTN